MSLENTLKFAFILCAGLFMAGCANYSSFQSADTVPEGEVTAGGGATYTRYQQSLGEETVSVGVPALAIWGRYGITDKFEAHANMWLPLGASVGAKYQLLGGRFTKGFSLSLGADVGYLQFSSGTEGNETTFQIIDLYVPVYTGYRFNKGFAAYLTPKYILRTAIGDTTNLAHNPGATLGVAIGEDFEFLIEGTAAYQVETEGLAFTGGVGVAF